MFVCFFDDTEPSEIYTYLHSLSLHDPLPICSGSGAAANSGANSPSASTAGVDGQSASISAGTSGLRGAGCGGALRTSTGVLAGSALGSAGGRLSMNTMTLSLLGAPVQPGDRKSVV